MIATAAILSLVASAAPAQSMQPAGEQQLGAFQFALLDLRDPAAVAFGPHGDIFVTDTGNHRIKAYDAQGRPQREWGRRGAGDGEFLFPSGIAIAPDGRVFVADTGNDRIQVFEVDGRFRHTFDVKGADQLGLNRPCAVAVRGKRIYIADEGNRRIVILEEDGKLALAFGRYGDKPGEFKRPSAVAVDAAGMIFVADADLCRISVFDSQGVFVRSFGQWGPYPGFLARPEGLAVANSHLYVAEADNHRVEVFSLDGVLQYRIGVHAVMPRDGKGRLHYPNAIAVAPDGKACALCEAFEDRCQVFGLIQPGTPPDPLANIGMDLGLLSHYGMRGDADGGLMAIVEPESHSVQVFDLSVEQPALVTQIGQRGSKFGEFVNPTDAQLDERRGLLYVCDSGNRRIQIFRLHRDPKEGLKFDPFMARFVKSIDVAALSRTIPAYQNVGAMTPTLLRMDGQGSIYVVDEPANLVCIFAPDFRLIRSWGGRGSGPGQFDAPTDLSLVRSGDGVLISDSGNRRIQAFDRQGEFLFEIGRDGPKDAQLGQPFGVAVDDAGHIYVTDSGSDRVVKYDSQGHLMKAWGTKGLGAGELFKPKGLFFDGKGRLIVIDFGNHRGHVFSTDGEYLSVCGSRFFTDPARIPKAPS